MEAVFWKLIEDMSGSIDEIEDCIIDNEMDLVTEEEMRETIGKLKVGKAARRDNTITEMIKSMAEMARAVRRCNKGVY